MSISVTNLQAAAVQRQGVVAPRNPAMREAMRDLTQSLKASDLDGARQAYAAILKNAPEGAQFPRGSDFADLGRALLRGDMPAAQAAFRSMLADKRPAPPLPPTPVPDGQVGSQLDVIA